MRADAGTWKRPRRSDAGITRETQMNIYVGNMSFDVTEADLRSAFEAFWVGDVGQHHQGPVQRATQRVRLRRDALGV
jgi:hypothetical protein